MLALRHDALKADTSGSPAVNVVREVTLSSAAIAASKACGCRLLPCGVATTTESDPGRDRVVRIMARMSSRIGGNR